MPLALAAVAALAAEPVPAAVRVRTAEPPGLCLSSIPRAGRLPKEARAPFVGAATLLATTATDRDAVGRWWTTFVPLLDSLPPHPALEGLRATVASVLDPGAGAEVLATLADAHPQDWCLTDAAAAAAFAAHDLDTARRMVGRAWIPAPSADLAYVLGEIVLADGQTDRLETVLAKGLALDPDHAGLLRLRAKRDLLDGRVDPATLASLEQRGDRSLDPLLMKTRWEDGDLDGYLRLAAAAGAPLAVAPGLAEAPSPMAALRQALGLASPDDPLRVVLVTSSGEIPCTLFPNQAPVTVAAFVGLATGRQPWTDPRTGAPGQGPLYADLPFHRVIPGFMIQGGDPLGTGTGGPGYQFHDETRPELGFDRPGRLAMANAGPGTNGSQFFVTDAPAPHLNGRHTIFGQCDAPTTVSAIANVPRDGRDTPRTPVLLHSVRVVPSTP